MGKRITKEELFFRLFEGDLSSDLAYFSNENEFIDIIYDCDAWGIVLKCKHCNCEYIRSIAKFKRHQQCPSKGCRVRRCKQTKLFLHGDENYNNLEQMKKTKLSIYGDTFGNRKKITESKRKLYGHDMCSNIEQRVDDYRKTRALNNSYMSSTETAVYNQLLTKFSTVKYNYYDKKRYPFLCDFYIEDIDTFIELNYHWSHGGEPFTGTKDQLDIVSYWYKKGWIGNIKSWTYRDVKKRLTAKLNNLSYLEFFTPEEFNKWFKSI